MRVWKIKSTNASIYPRTKVDTISLVEVLACARETMSAILGIDAAWTSNHPSGVALIRQMKTGKWESVRVSCSYEKFLEYPTERTSRSVGGSVPVAALVETAIRLAQTDVNLVVADIPIAMVPISGLRCADRKVSKLFGDSGCSTHAPSSIRPGRVSEEIRDGFRMCGFPLVTQKNDLSDHALIETYPHPALLSLMKTPYRVPYKIGNSKKYWCHLGQKERLIMIREKLDEILAALRSVIEGIDFEVPQNPQGFSALKPIEDKIDALVCAWVGIQVMEGRAMAIGNKEASIWLPADPPPSARPRDWSAYLASDAVASEEFMDGLEDLPVQNRST
jgi:predicted RNase H-like nuclease